MDFTLAAKFAWLLILHSTKSICLWLHLYQPFQVFFCSLWHTMVCFRGWFAYQMGGWRSWKDPLDLVLSCFREQIPGGSAWIWKQRAVMHLEEQQVLGAGLSVLKTSCLSRERDIQIVFPYISMQAGGIMAEERQGRGFVMVTGRWLRMWVERARPELVTSANWSSAMVSMINDLILGQRNGTPQGGVRKAARESAVLLQHWPLSDQCHIYLIYCRPEGNFPCFSLYRDPLFPWNNLPVLQPRQENGCNHTFWVPLEALCEFLCRFKAGDTDVSGPCMCVWIYEWPVQLAGSQGLCVCVNWYQGCTKSFHASAPLSIHCEMPLVQHPAWCFLFEALGFSLHMASALFSDLSLIDLSGPGGFIELGKIYGFQSCFWGCKWTQAMLKWTIRCIPVAEEAQRNLHEGTVGAVRKVRPWRICRTEQTVQFSLPQPGVFVVQLGWTGAEAIGFCVLTAVPASRPLAWQGNDFVSLQAHISFSWAPSFAGWSVFCVYCGLQLPSVHLN